MTETPNLMEKFTSLTDDVLYGDIWQREGLSVRDRCLVTVSAIVALNRLEQLPFHLKRALDNGVTLPEIEEQLTHLAFYAGWPCVVSAREVLRKLI